MPKKKDSIFKPKLYSPDKIRDVQLLENKIKDKFSQITLSIQFSNCLVTSSLNTEKHEVQIELPDMVPRY